MQSTLAMLVEPLPHTPCAGCFPACTRPVAAEIYLCNARSSQALEDGNAQVGLF
jgi:hypothetical protein